MKEIIITPKRQKTEIMWLARCFIAAVLMNVFAIIGYQTAWKELYTQILWVFIITCVLYAISMGVRVAFFWIKRLLK